MNIRCQRCGRVLTDPVSQALRMGPECRGGSRPASRRQVRVNNRVLRGVAYAEKTTVNIGQTVTYQYDAKDDSWKSEKSASTHEKFGEWLLQFQLVTMPADHLASLKVHKNTAAQILKDTRAQLDQDQVQMIKCELTRLKEDIQKFSNITKGAHNATTQTKKR
jgi:hypothetical protein